MVKLAVFVIILCAFFHVEALPSLSSGKIAVQYHDVEQGDHEPTAIMKKRQIRQVG